MPELNFELPDGVTFNDADSKEVLVEEPDILRKLSCPNCQFIIKSTIVDNYGRYSGKIILNKDNVIWQGKLASNSEKSKKQILDIFNKKIKEHLAKCKG